MSYSEFLSKTIKESGYSLRAIADLCEQKYNVTITASYLSKLQKGVQTPASEKVNIAVAKVCGINPDDLLFEADFERAPESVKKLTNSMVYFLKSFLETAKPNIKSNDKETQTNIENEFDKYNNMSMREFIQFMIESDDILHTENPFELDLGDIGEAQNIELEDMFMKFSIGKTMLDNSMFPVIKQGAKLELVKLEEYKSGDIVSVSLDDEKSIVRTYVDVGENIVLIPANNEFESLTISKDKIKINGKIKSYSVDL